MASVLNLVAGPVHDSNKTELRVARKQSHNSQDLVDQPVEVLEPEVEGAKSSDADPNQVKVQKSESPPTE